MIVLLGLHAARISKIMFSYQAVQCPTPPLDLVLFRFCFWIKNKETTQLII